MAGPKPFYDQPITSRQNAVFSTLVDCLSGKGIRKHGLFIISGEKVVRETLIRHTSLVRNALVCLDRHASDADSVSLMRDARMKLATRKDGRAFSVLALARELFDELDVFGTKTPLLVLQTPEMPEADLTKKPDGLEVVAALGDPANLGALLRSAAAFGAGRIILLKESASPFHPKAVRAASAATLQTPLVRGPSISELVHLSESSRGHLVALDMEGESTADFAWPRDVRLLLGEEGPGVASREAFRRLSIPIASGVESLNASVAASVALYAYRAKHSQH